MKVIETRPREIGFVLWGHCQNLLDDPRTLVVLELTHVVVERRHCFVKVMSSCDIVS